MGAKNTKFGLRELGSNPSFNTFQPCDFGQVIESPFIQKLRLALRTVVRMEGDSCIKWCRETAQQTEAVFVTNHYCQD